MLNIIENVTEQVSECQKKFPIFRKKERKLALDILCQTRQRHLVVLGDEGVGRTSFVNELAEYCLNDKKNAHLQRWRFLRVDVSRLLAESDFSANDLDDIFNAMDSDDGQPIILVFDQLEALLQCDLLESQILIRRIKRALFDDKIQFIFIVNYVSYQQFFVGNGGLSHFCQTVCLNSLGNDDAIKIMKLYLAKRKKTIPIIVEKDLLEKTVLWAKRYSEGMGLPGAALDLLDAAVSAMLVSGKKKLTLKIMAKCLSEKLGISLDFFLQSEKDKILALAENLNKEIVGQAQAISSLQQALEAHFLNLNHDRPSLLLLIGPDGVGKTTTVRCLVKALYGTEAFLFRVNMKDFQQLNELPALLQQIKAFVRHCPYAVCLFDQVDKTDPRVVTALQRSIANTYVDEVSLSCAFFVMTMDMGLEALPQTQLAIQDTSQKTELLQLVLDDLPGAHELSAPQSDVQPNCMEHIGSQVKFCFGTQFYHHVVTIPFAPLTQEALFCLVEKALDKLNTSLVNNHHIKLEYASGFIARFLGLLSLQDCKAEDVFSLFSQKIVKVVSDLLMHSQPKKAKSYSLYLEMVQNDVCASLK